MHASTRFIQARQPDRATCRLEARGRSHEFAATGRRSRGVNRHASRIRIEAGGELRAVSTRRSSRIHQTHESIRKIRLSHDGRRPTMRS
ncbi:hypothetical protein C7S14_3045 [Burkholderia cepacia]|nr:hypothetical protein C7S14_3045 [Burkholderia cepacia]